MSRLISFALLALCLAAGGTQAQDTRQPLEAAGPCAAARAKVDYGRLLRIPDSLKGEIETYRAGWREACARTKRVSLHALLARGDAIAKAFATVLEKSGIKQTKYEELHELVQEAYPRFIPAFAGSIIEYEYFEPDLAAFARMAVLGDAEDKLFFARRRQLYGDDPHAFPWLERTWDHGGCVRFGTFDWLAAIERIEGLEAKLKGAAYRRRLADLKARMRSYLMEPAVAGRAGKKPVVDSCAPRAPTLAAMETVARGLSGRKGWEKVATGLRKTIGDIRANRVEVCTGCSGS